MARRWTRRSVIIGAIIVVLSVGLVFASLAYLQPPPGPHASIEQTLSHTVRSGNQTYPGFYGLKIPNITISESFYVGVSVVNGAASFCVLEYQPYFSWALSYNQTVDPGSSLTCAFQFQQTSQDTLKFSVTPGTWVVVALNTGPSEVTVYFLPA